MPVFGELSVLLGVFEALLFSLLIISCILLAGANEFADYNDYLHFKPLLTLSHLLHRRRTS